MKEEAAAQATGMQPAPSTSGAPALPRRTAALAPAAPSPQRTSSSPVAVYMCGTLLTVSPLEVEQRYWLRYKQFDALNCLIPLLYFSKTLAEWFTPLLAAVYGSVLLLKLAHAYLLLRRPEACLRWRSSILFAERLIRTFVCVRLVAYSESYKTWLERSMAMRSARVLLLNSGFTVACWNLFCLPLGMPAQISLTAAFVLSIIPGSLADVAGMFAGLVSRARWLVHIFSRSQAAAGRGGALLAHVLLRGSLLAPPGEHHTIASAVAAMAATTAPAVVGSGELRRSLAGGGQADGMCVLDAPANAATAPETLLAATLAVTYTLFACGAVPLWLAYHIERVYKQRWLAGNPGLAWLNPPADGSAGRWPGARAAAAQLGALLAGCLLAAASIINAWEALGLPVWGQPA